MSLQTTLSYARYLEAKKSLDDRSLNRHVYGVLARQLAKLPTQRPLTILEVGAGIGTMLARLLEWGLLREAVYTAIDSRPDFVNEADNFLAKWAQRWDYQLGHSSTLERNFQRFEQSVRLEYVPEAMEDFLANQSMPHWDILIAHAFLDLVDLECTLPELVRVVNPGGYLYLTMNFDGGTIFEPTIESGLDAKIEQLYHASMDQRFEDSTPSGSSQTGRKLLTHLRRLGLPIHAAGSSDWVVHTGPQGYPEGEEFFLSFILDTIEDSLRDHPELMADHFSSWMETRRAQLETGKLVYIAHQLDLLAVKPEQ